LHECQTRPPPPFVPPRQQCKSPPCIGKHSTQIQILRSYSACRCLYTAGLMTEFQRLRYWDPRNEVADGTALVAWAYRRWSGPCLQV
jgi:hypothetical protein